MPDLTLYTDAQLRADVKPNPWREHERLASGRPAEIGDLAAAFAKAGGDMELAHRFSTEAQDLLGANYTNNGQPVYTEADHFGHIPKNFPDAGTHLTDLARQLDTVADDLDERTRNLATARDEVVTQLEQKRTAWAAEVTAALGAAALSSPHVVDFDRLISRRDTLRAEQRAMVSAAGGEAKNSVGEYESGLQTVMRKLADIGYLPPDPVELGPGDFTAAAGTAAADDVTNALKGSGGGMDQVAAASEGVEMLNAKVANGGTLTENEAQFLQAYYDRLASSGSFENLGGTSGDGDSTRTTIANGLMNLSQVGDGRYVPSSVHDLFNADNTDYGGGRFTYEGSVNLITHATVDGGTTFTKQLGESALHAMQSQAWEDRGGGPNATIGRASDMKPMNDLLHLVAKDAEASQALIGNREDRHTLLAVRGEDTSGAAAVLTTATKPDQKTAALAFESGKLSQHIFEELGDDPRSWRAIIPKGGDVSDAITRLAAQRMDTFAYSGGLSARVEDPLQNADGTWTAPVRLSSDRGSEQGDDRIDFLKFVASGSDLNDPKGDPDMQKLQGAADTYVVHQLSNALRAGDDVTTPLAQAGNLSGVIERGQYEALIDESVAADEAAARAHADKNFGITLAERFGMAYSVTGRIAAQLPNTIVGDTVMVSVDRVIDHYSPPPEPQTNIRASELLDDNNQDYLDHRSYLIALAKQDAGVLPEERPDTVFGSLGDIRSFEQMRQLPGDPMVDLTRVANAAPDGVKDWDSSLLQSSERRAGYDPTKYPGEDNPDGNKTGVTNEYRAELWYGNSEDAKEWRDYVFDDDGNPYSGTGGEDKI